MEAVKSIMTRKVIHFDENSTVYEIARELGKYDIGCAIITRNKKPIGIITERDVVKRVVAKDLDPRKVKAKEVMTSPVDSLHENTNIYYASRVMQEKKYQRYPVVKGIKHGTYHRYPVVKRGKIIGVITQSDIIDFLTEQRKKFVLKQLRKKDRKHYL